MLQTMTIILAIYGVIFVIAVIPDWEDLKMAKIIL